MPYGKKYTRSEFDVSLDEELWRIETEPGQLPKENILVVMVKAYNGGVPKVHCVRRTVSGKSLNMGRWTAKEIRLLAPLLQKAAEKIEAEFGEKERRSSPLWDEPKD